MACPTGRVRAEGHDCGGPPGGSGAATATGSPVGSPCERWPRCPAGATRPGVRGSPSRASAGSCTGISSRATPAASPRAGQVILGGAAGHVGLEQPVGPAVLPVRERDRRGGRRRGRRRDRRRCQCERRPRSHGRPRRPRGRCEQQAAPRTGWRSDGAAPMGQCAVSRRPSPDADRPRLRHRALRRRLSGLRRAGRVAPAAGGHPAAHPDHLWHAGLRALIGADVRH